MHIIIKSSSSCTGNITPNGMYMWAILYGKETGVGGGGGVKFEPSSCYCFFFSFSHKQKAHKGETKEKGRRGGGGGGERKSNIKISNESKPLYTVLRLLPNCCCGYCWCCHFFLGGGVGREAEGLLLIFHFTALLFVSEGKYDSLGGGGGHYKQTRLHSMSSHAVSTTQHAG